jgi:AraC-like DNA-binding protein
MSGESGGTGDGGALYRAGFGRSVPRGHVRIGPAIAIPDVLRSLGVAPEPVIAEAGIPAALFGDPDHTLPMVRLGRLAALSAAATGRGDFGLLVADGTTASNLGLVGFLLKQAPDVRTALDDLVRYLHHSDRSAVPSLHVADGVATFGYCVIEPNVPGLEIIYDGAIAIARNVLRGLCDPKWVPLEVAISRRRPANPLRYERYFAAPVAFDAEATTISFSEHWLDTPIRTADAALRRLLREQIDLLEAEQVGGLPEQVRRLLRGLMMSRRGSIDDVARLLGVSSRTLARRLDEAGASFREISDEVQFELARQLIENTAMTITQISLVLGYSEISAFSRAFRLWGGAPPRAWRQRARSVAR